MGCDGGTIPKRDELVRKKKKEEQKDKNADILAKWRYCALSCNELRPPIVACELGFLYNKESVIEYLLNRVTISSNPKASHIRGLRDVIELNLTEKNGYQSKPTDNSNEYIDNQDSRYICPVTALEMNGKYRFLFFRECGCVISERAFKEISSNVCLKCNKSINLNDHIIINATDDEIKKYRENMEIRRAEAKLKKQNKKRKFEEIDSKNETPTCSSASTSSDKELTGNKSKKDKQTVSSSTSNKNSSIKSSTASILPPTARDDYSVAKDPEKSEAFKSLFTSHKSAVKPKSHWVTYNPLYF